MPGYDTLVDAFGLDEFGNPYGLGEAIGAGIGAAVGSGTVIAMNHLVDATKHPDIAKHKELFGAGAAVVAGGIMMIFKGTRRAGLIAGITGLIANGSRYIDSLIIDKMAVTDATKAASARAGLGDTILQRVAPFKGAGLGDTVLQSVKPAAQLGAPSYAVMGAMDHAVISAPMGHFGTSVMGA